MISSVSNVNFRGDAASVNAQDLINSPGKKKVLLQKRKKVKLLQ